MSAAVDLWYPCLSSSICLSLCEQLAWGDMEVSRGTSTSSTVDREPHSAHLATQEKGGNGEAAAMGQDTTQAEPDRFEGNTLTAREQQETKQQHAKELSLDSQEERERGQYMKRSDLSVFGSLRHKCSETINHEDATIPLAWQALLTGLVDALLYTRGTIWTGFQTGNMVQFSENIAQYMLPNETKMPLLTLLRALSVSSFITGSFVGAKLGSRFGDKKRGWIVSTSIIQSIFLFGASAILLSRPVDEPPNFQYWPGVVVMTAFSMGMQSIAAQKLVSPAFATTVAFTASLTQIASDPYLFALSLSPVEQHRQRQAEKQSQQEGNVEAQGKVAKAKPPKTLGRDRRLLAIFALCTGGGVAQCLLYSRADLRGGLTVAAGFKMIQALLWLMIPSAEKAQ